MIQYFRKLNVSKNNKLKKKRRKSCKHINNCKMHSLKGKKILIMIRLKIMIQKNILIHNQSVLLKMKTFKAKSKNKKMDLKKMKELKI